VWCCRVVIPANRQYISSLEEKGEYDTFAPLPGKTKRVTVSALSPLVITFFGSVHLTQKVFFTVMYN
jgi:hypothetical protein